MTANSKDRHTWRKIPRLAVEEARRRVGLSTPKTDDDPPTRTSWLPSVRLPEVRRTSIKVIEPAQRAQAPRVAQPKPQNAELFRGGETLPWQPSSEADRGPLMRANVIHDAAALSAAVGGGLGLAATVAATRDMPPDRSHDQLAPAIGQRAAPHAGLRPTLFPLQGGFFAGLNGEL